MDSPILVVAGVPASGKSTFARGLQNRGFYYFTLNGEDSEHRTDDLQQEAWLAYNRVFAGEATETLIAVIRRAPLPAVVEWGFPPNDRALQIVKDMRAHRARFVWLDCPTDVARKRFRKRERGNVASMRAFDQQMSLIDARWNDIAHAASPLIVNVLRDGRAVRSTNDLYNEIAGEISLPTPDQSFESRFSYIP